MLYKLIYTGFAFDYDIQHFTEPSTDKHKIIFIPSPNNFQPFTFASPTLKRITPTKIINRNRIQEEHDRVFQAIQPLVAAGHTGVHSRNTRQDFIRAKTIHIKDIQVLNIE